MGLNGNTAKRLLGYDSTVDHHFGAGDKGGLIRGKIDDHVGNIIGLPDSP